MTTRLLTTLIASALASAALAQAPVPATETRAVSALPETPAMRDWYRSVSERARRFIKLPRESPIGAHEVVVRMTIDPQGNITDALLHASSGYPVLDDTVMAGLRRMGRLPTLPERIGAEGLQFDVNFRLYAGTKSVMERWGVIHPGLEDKDHRVRFQVPPPFDIESPRSRPGHAWIVGVTSSDATLAPLPGQTRVCDVSLQVQRPEWRTLTRDQLTAPAHMDRIEATLRADVHAQDAVSLPMNVRFGRVSTGREIVVTPRHRPAERHYLAIADTPDYRLSMACASTEDHFARALPLFRAIAHSVQPLDAEPAVAKAASAAGAPRP